MLPSLLLRLAKDGRRTGLVIVCLVVTLALTVPQGSSLAQGGDPVLVGAGDIANCGANGDELTANLLDNIPGIVFAAGDLQYGDASLGYEACYGPSWGRHKGRTRPIPGNHDYSTPGAAKYFAYFGDAAGPVGKGYYSYDLGAWHIIALNTNPVKGLQEEESKWLIADLAAHPNVCTLAIGHNPVFSSGIYGVTAYSKLYFKILYDAGADVFISGDAHDYERFAPQSLYGQKQPTRGIRQFVVGTGGAPTTRMGAKWRNSEARNDQTWGVLKLTLHATSYSWEFVPVAGGKFSDSGTSPCVVTPTGL